jgi:dynein heavy chain
VLTITGLRSLTKNDINELKVFLPTPPERIQKILETICILKGVPPTLPDATTVLNEPLLWMITYNKENVSGDTLAKLKKYIINPEFTPNGIESKAAKWLCHWVIGIYRYSNVYKAVQPKRAKVSEMETQLQDIQKALKEKQRYLQQAEEKLDQFKEVYKATNEKKIQLEQKNNDLMVQLNRAEKILESLDGKGEDWTNKIKKNETTLSRLVGNVLLYAAAITYLGPYDSATRKRIIPSWIDKCHSLGVPYDPDFSIDMFTSELEFREWHRLGLPTDLKNKENAILLLKNSRWPFLIDPEGQVIRWIKHIERSNQIKVLDLDASNFIRTLETSIASGRPLIIENMSKTLHPELYTLIVTLNFSSRREDQSFVSISTVSSYAL